MFFPGITDTRVDVELVFRAKSSAKFIIFETFTPGAGSNSYKLTTGPLLIALIFPSIPKSRRIFSMNSPSGRFLFNSDVLNLVELFSKYSIAGSLYFNFKLFVGFSVLIDSPKEKDCCGLSIISFFSSIKSVSKFTF